MANNKKINVQGLNIVLYEHNSKDFISLTDIARHKDPEHTDTIIQNWMRNRNTIELLGFWETIYNPDFNPLEFEGVKKNFFSLHSLTPNGIGYNAASYIQVNIL